MRECGMRDAGSSSSSSSCNDSFGYDYEDDYDYDYEDEDGRSKSGRSRRTVVAPRSIVWLARIRPSFLFLAFPVPGNPHADFVEQLQRDGHHDLSKNLGRRQQRSQNEVDHDHVAAHGREFPVVEDSDLH